MMSSATNRWPRTTRSSAVLDSADADLADHEDATPNTSPDRREARVGAVRSCITRHERDEVTRFASYEQRRARLSSRREQLSRRCRRGTHEALRLAEKASQARPSARSLSARNRSRCPRARAPTIGSCSGQPVSARPGVWLRGAVTVRVRPAVPTHRDRNSFAPRGSLTMVAGAVGVSFSTGVIVAKRWNGLPSAREQTAAARGI